MPYSRSRALKTLNYFDKFFTIFIHKQIKKVRAKNHNAPKLHAHIENVFYVPASFYLPNFYCYFESNTYNYRETLTPFACP